MKKKILIFTLIVSVALLPGCGGLFSYLAEKGRTISLAEEAAEEHLQAKYRNLTKKMENQNTTDGGFRGYTVFYHYPEVPMLKFEVHVPIRWDDDALGEEGTIYVDDCTDNFIANYFSIVAAESLPLEWDNTSSVFFWVEDTKRPEAPTEITDISDIMAMDKHYNYKILVSTSEGPQALGKQSESKKIFDFVQNVKKIGYTPYKIVFEYYSKESSLEITIKDLKSIKCIEDVQQIIENPSQTNHD